MTLSCLLAALAANALGPPEALPPPPPPPPPSANDHNLLVMLANPADLHRDGTQPPARADVAAAAVKALLEGKSKPLIDPINGSIAIGGHSGTP